MKTTIRNFADINLSSVTAIIAIVVSVLVGVVVYNMQIATANNTPSIVVERVNAEKLTISGYNFQAEKNDQSTSARSVVALEGTSKTMQSVTKVSQDGTFVATFTIPEYYVGPIGVSVTSGDVSITHGYVLRANAIS